MQAHYKISSYENLKSLACLDLGKTIGFGKWFGSADEKFTQMWPDEDAVKSTNPWELKGLRIAEIEYYAPAKHYIYSMKVKLSDGRQSPLFGDHYYDDPYLQRVQFPADRPIHSVLVDCADGYVYRL